MDYNKFEDRISDWIENSMDIKDRKEFEKFLAENPEYQSKVDSVRNSINIMKSAPSLKTSEAFDSKLQDRINSINNSIDTRSSTPVRSYSPPPSSNISRGSNVSSGGSSRGGNSRGKN